MKPTVYIETTVISYLVAGPSRDLVVAAHQQITQEWRDNALPQFEAFVSAVVLEEILRGDSRTAASRLQAIEDFPALEVLPEVRELAECYYSAIEMPEKARADS